jgi:hypothetical protein
LAPHTKNRSKIINKAFLGYLPVFEPFLLIFIKLLVPVHKAFISFLTVKIGLSNDRPVAEEHYRI